jgi:cobaltochelatase CobN
MHLIATIPGGWNPDEEGIFYIEQQVGDIIFLSAADTEIHTLNEAYKELYSAQAGLPSLRMCNLLYLKQELTIDTYLEEVLEKAKVIVCRMLGGASYYQYLIESLREMQARLGNTLILLPAHEPDLELMKLSSVDLPIAHQCHQYLEEGGKENYKAFFMYLQNRFFESQLAPAPPLKVADMFLYHPQKGIISQEEQNALLNSAQANVVLLAYRTHYLADNLDPVHSMVRELEKRGTNPLIAFVSKLRDEHSTRHLEALITNEGQRTLHALINTTGFAIKSISEENKDFIFDRLGIPVIQAILSSSTREVWEDGLFGLTPTDIAMNIALPEVDGRIIGRAVSFKKQVQKDPLTDSAIIRYEAYAPACAYTAELCLNWLNLQQKRNEQKRVAVILPNYPNKDSRLANGVGLDTPQSCIELLRNLASAGYTLGNSIPQDTETLINWLTQLVTNNLDTTESRPYALELSEKDFNIYYHRLSDTLKEKVESQWGKPQDSPYYTGDGYIIPGFQLGNIFVSIQPSRGYNQDPQAIYHSPDLPPTYQYLAYYFWVNQVYKADAVIHLGKHGNLEWLPGKSVSLDERSCFPAALFGPLPHFYPFIINDPGEGTQAKRRNGAVIIDHLIPPMTRAETYGSLLKLEQLVDEYYEASNIDPKRSRHIRQEIARLVEETKLTVDLGISSDDVDELMLRLDGYLCELKEAQIRDGLHILGQSPQDEQLLDLLIALHRVPGGQQKGITQALALDLGIEGNILEIDYAEPLEMSISGKTSRTAGDVVEALELLARECLQQYLSKEVLNRQFPQFNSILKTIREDTLPKVKACSEEVSHLLQGLNGRYVPSGPSGAPTRGRLDLLPTGRNFYSVDVRTIPTETAYRLGTKSAQLIIDRYLQEHGDYPETIGISVWGTSTMRTGGDDIAQAFALMGVRPLWKNANRRVTDFEVIPLFQLGRPRVDVTLRISGFFRDAFPDVIALFNAAVERVAALEEAPEENPVRKRVLQEKEEWLQKGLSEEKAHNRAHYRVFGSKPGAYGAGLQAVIDEKNWQSAEDLARVYINWSGYAYGRDRKGVSAHEAFNQRLASMQVVVQNQDNREHDILDSDDYYQFQGGLANAVQSVKGEQPDILFGDHSRPETPKIKSLKEELLKVYRSRVVNPKWIEGVKRHGYKGAFEMAATLDYLFAYDATTGLVDDFMYEGIAEAYLFNEANKDFIRQANPWALKDMSERLLEAAQRGMWAEPSEEIIEQLKELYLEGEGMVE